MSIRHRNILILLLATLAILVVAVISIFALSSSSDANNGRTTAKDPSTQSTKSDTEGTSTISEDSTSTTLDLKENEINVAINSPFESQTFSDTITVRVVVVGATEGTCAARFNHEGSDEKKFEAKLIQAPTYYTCEGFDIDRSEFDKAGTWTVRVDVTSNEAKGSSENRKFILQ